MTTRTRFAPAATASPAGRSAGNDVTIAAMSTNPTRNHGSFAADVPRSPVRRARAHPMTSATGTIQSARASFTVVATSTAFPPQVVAAPTTELVSWIASAANRPNPSSSRPARCPSGGNTTSATALRRNTVASATEMDSDLRLDRGSHGRDRAASADRGPRRHEKRRVLLDAEQPREEKPGAERQPDSDGRVPDPPRSHASHDAEVRGRAEPHDRDAEKEGRELPRAGRATGFRKRAPRPRPSRARPPAARRAEPRRPRAAARGCVRASRRGV